MVMAVLLCSRGWMGSPEGPQRTLPVATRGPQRRSGSGHQPTRDNALVAAGTERRVGRMDFWHMALDLVTEARDDINKQGISMTPDQKLYTARIYATLAVAQELAGDTR